MKRRLLALFLVLAMLGALLVGCGTKETPAATDDAATKAEDTADTDAEPKKEEEAEEAKSDKPFKLGISLQSLENSYWAGVFGEVDKLLTAKGWDFTIVSCEDSSATQIQQIENFIINEVDFIMVHPSDPNALEDYLKEARDAGIKVMSWDDEMENTDLNWVLENTALGFEIGSAAADFINEHFTPENQAQVAILNYPQTPVLLEREQGIMKGLEEVAGGKYEIVASQPALDASAALSSMETILQAHPDVKIVCTIGAGGDIGANEAFLTSTGGNIPDDMGIFSADATQQQLEAIKNGEASRTSVGFEGSNKRTAAAVVDIYDKLLNGEAFPEHNVVRPLARIDISNVGEFLADYE